MTVTVAMHERSLEHIGARLEALGLDVEVLTFGKDGRFRVGDASVSPGEVDINYFWLSTHASKDGGQQVAFDTVLGCRSVGVLQTYNAGLDHPFYRKAAERGIRLCNSSAQGVAIAEYIAQVMSVLHPVAEQRRMQHAGEWRTTPFREISRTHWLLPADDPYWTHPKVRLTPHTSFAGDGGQARWDRLFLDNIVRFAKGQPLIREVDPSDI